MTGQMDTAVGLWVVIVVGGLAAGVAAAFVLVVCLYGWLLHHALRSSSPVLRQALLAVLADRGLEWRVAVRIVRLLR